jgi:hypothetical protein
MTWNGKRPTVKMVEKPYAAGVKLTKAEISVYEKAIIWRSGLENWSVGILPKKDADESSLRKLRREIDHFVFSVA